MRKMTKVFLDSLNSSIGIGIYCMSFGVYQYTKLYHKLLKASKIKLLSLSFIQQFNIQISYKWLHFIFWSQEK